METAVFYFSGTGNCLAAARAIGARLDAPVHAITAMRLDEGGYTCPGRTVVVYPSYAYGAPSLVRRFFKRADFSESEDIAVVVSFGSRPGAAHGQARNILKRRGKQVRYFGFLRSIENYIPIFGTQKDAVKERRLRYEEEDLIKILDDITAGTQNRVRRFQPLYGVVSAVFRAVKPIFPALFYRVSDACNGCGICRDVCPAGAIAIEDGRPDFTAARCEHCQACLNFCPKNALNFARMRQKTPRYAHPTVRLLDMRRAVQAGLPHAPAVENERHADLSEAELMPEIAVASGDNAAEEN